MALWPQVRNGVHPSETGGSPDIPKKGGPNDSNLALGTAANGAVTPRKTGVHSKRARPAEPAASQSGKSAKHPNLTGRCRVKASLSKTECPVARNSVKPIPG